MLMLCTSLLYVLVMIAAARSSYSRTSPNDTAFPLLYVRAVGCALCKLWL